MLCDIAGSLGFAVSRAIPACLVRPYFPACLCQQMYTCHVVLQDHVAALEARMQEARAKLLRAKEKTASVHTQHISRYREVPLSLDSCRSTSPPECNRAQRPGGAEREVSCPHVEPVPDVVRCSAVAKWTQHAACFYNLTPKSGTDRCNVLVLFHTVQRSPGSAGSSSCTALQLKV